MEEVAQIPIQLLAELLAVLESLEAEAVIQHTTLSRSLLLGLGSRGLLRV